jgi:hypothetical protein
MAHISTPSSFIRKHKTLLPGKYTMKIVLGYSAALRIVHSEKLGEIEIILN